MMKHTYETKKLPDGCVEFKSNILVPESVWDEERKYEERKYEEEIREGLRLYAKYFMDLWD